MIFADYLVPTPEVITCNLFRLISVFRNSNKKTGSETRLPTGGTL
jgi:hypothetical protein